MIKAVFFDLDGTLLDTIDDIGGSMNRVLTNRGYPTHPIPRYKNFVGNGMPSLVRQAVPQKKNLSDPEIDDMIREMKQIFAENWKNKSKLYPGIKEVLSELEDEGYLLGILSNKPHEFTVTTYQHFLKAWDFKTVLGYDPKRHPLKPDPASLQSLLHQWDLKKEETLYVGDSDVDMEFARNAGVKSIGAAWGFRGGKELRDSGADFVAEEPKEILAIVHEN